MKFTLLQIDNFLAITGAQIRLDDRGLVLIQGANLDDTSAESNGAGKSSLADALCWALYGETARGVSGDAVINDKAGKGTRVSIDVEDGEDVYRVVRHRKHKTGKNALHVLLLKKDGTITELTKGTDKLTQDVVNRIIGASHDVFKAAVYAGQEQMPDLPAMTDKHLKVLIEEAAGVTLLEEAYGQARDKLNASVADRDKIAVELDRLNDRRRMVLDEIDNTTAAIATWDVNHKTRLRADKAEVAATIEKVKEIERTMAAIDHVELRAKLDACDAALAALGTEQKKHRELVTAATRADAAASRAADHERDMKVEAERAKKELDGVSHKIGCPCDECGRPLSADELASATEAGQKRLRTALVNYKDARGAHELARKTLGDAQGALKTFEATMTDASATSVQRASLQREIDAFNALEAQRSSTVMRARTLGGNLKILAAETNPHSVTLGKHQHLLTSLETDIAALDTKAKEANANVAVNEAVVKVFSPAGVRAHILDEVTPYLNQQTESYLSTLSDGNIEAVWTTLVKNAKGELREKFAIEVTNTKGAKSFAGLSGGEKRKVRVATALALQDLVATRATKPIDLFIGDEIDDALDAAGLERLTMILEEKARERGSVFVISHNSLRDWVSQVVTVQKKDGETVLVEETV